MKPSTLAYGVDDRPPPIVALLSAVQHVAMVTGLGVVFPLLVRHEAGADDAATDHVIRLSMVAGMAMLTLHCVVTPLADQVRMRHDGDRQTIKLSFHH